MRLKHVEQHSRRFEVRYQGTAEISPASLTRSRGLHHKTPNPHSPYPDCSTQDLVLGAELSFRRSSARLIFWTLGFSWKRN